MVHTRRNVRRAFVATLVAAVLGIGLIATRPAPAGPPPGTWLEFSFRLPAIGNVDLVTSWEYGRIARVEQSRADELILELRSAAGDTVKAVCPYDPFMELARVSQWLRGSGQTLGARVYVERMVAYDVDDTGRIVALVSLEPIPRDGRSIARAFRP